MRWSVVIPYFNEAAGIGETLASLAAQSIGPFHLILIDNGSTDNGALVCHRALAAHPHIRATHLHEPRPGQVHALKTGIAAATGDLIATCDADTYYPPHYLETATRQYDAGGPDLIAVMAYLMPERPWRARAVFERWHWLTAAKLWPLQNHTSGAGQTFRLEALRAAGGYDAAIWPYVLKDHELLSRVLRHGRQQYDSALWCISSERRQSRAAVRWTLPERLAYHFTPVRDKRAFFHGFLAPRFAKRGLADTKLRERSWEPAPQPV